MSFQSLPKGNGAIGPWQAALDAVNVRYSHEFRREPFNVPDEVAAMPIYQDFVAGKLSGRIATPFWQLLLPKKNWRCLDLGCGLSFLIYPWLDWQALFQGRDICPVACEFLNSRAPQLNSKLFKGTLCGAAHQLDDYAPKSFDLVVATGVSCYYPLDYWEVVLAQVKRLLVPGGTFLFDAIAPEAPLAENWAILETYLGAEVLLEEGDRWSALVKSAGGQITKTLDGEVFRGYRVKFP